MQRTPDLRLALMSPTGDHNLVRERIPYCQQLVMEGAMHKVKRCFLEQPLDRSAISVESNGTDCDYVSQ